MIQSAKDRGLAIEEIEAVPVDGAARVKNLERNLTVVLSVDRKHRLREAPASKWTDELISVGDQR